MSKKLRNRYAKLTKGQHITAHTVIFRTGPDPKKARTVKASLWVDDAIFNAIVAKDDDGEYVNPTVAVKADTVHLRHHVTRAEFADVMSYRYQLPKRAEADRSEVARATSKSVGQGHYSASLMQYAGPSGAVHNEENWVTLGEILAIRQDSDHGFPFYIQGHTWTKADRERMTDYLQRYFGADA